MDEKKMRELKPDEMDKVGGGQSKDNTKQEPLRPCLYCNHFIRPSERLEHIRKYQPELSLG